MDPRVPAWGQSSEWGEERDEIEETRLKDLSPQEGACCQLHHSAAWWPNQDLNRWSPFSIRAEVLKSTTSELRNDFRRVCSFLHAPPRRDGGTCTRTVIAHHQILAL